MAETSIEWTDATWNPVTGCSKVSPGCKHCYAETIANRFWKDREFTDVRTHEDRLDAPLHWKKPRRVFVNSMSDLFHEDVPFDFVLQVCNVMASEQGQRHIYQVLTKRPQRMLEFFQWAGENAPGDFPFSLAMEVDGFLPSVWWGVSVEDQQRADERIPLLLQTPAAVRFLSCEPLLGPVNLEIPIQVDWVICGGESGPKARPCDLAWIRSIVQQCKGAGVPCFVKQLGSRPFYYDPLDRLNLGPKGVITVDGEKRRRRKNGVEIPRTEALMILQDKKGGDPAEWPAELRVREFPTDAPAPGAAGRGEDTRAPA